MSKSFRELKSLVQGIYFFGSISHEEFLVKQCRVEETLTKPCFVLIGLVMFFNFANLDTKLMVAILGQDCSLV